MASDRTREAAKDWLEQASHRYHRHDVTGMGSDCEVCVDSLVALLDAFERETRIDEASRPILCSDINHRLRCNCARIAELAAQPTPEVKK